MYQGSAGGRSVRSVAFDGTRVLWTDCAFPAGSGCAVRKYDGGTTRTVSFGTVGAENVVGDATAMFWSDTLPKRYGH
jgi:hypothetical protein